MKKGFTLIELLVVVLIIGILAAIALPQYTKAVDKSRMAQAFITLRDISAAQDIHLMQTGSFPESFSDMDIEIKGDTLLCSALGLAAKECISSGKFAFAIFDNGLSQAFYIPSGDKTLANTTIALQYSPKNAEKNERFCIVKNGTDKAKQLCKSLGAADTSTANYYLLP
ncbi:prepilin-type N-terminal cleavage/methylation domain-containing protein [Elusimicrobium posterum]|uniref:type IV pilin protein n=1 Tax=Elusimicrobium posterum TaxID=3116653 RepID=UPI003C72DD35